MRDAQIHRSGHAGTMAQQAKPGEQDQQMGKRHNTPENKRKQRQQPSAGATQREFRRRAGARELARRAKHPVVVARPWRQQATARERQPRQAKLARVVAPPPGCASDTKGTACPCRPWAGRWRLVKRRPVPHGRPEPRTCRWRCTPAPSRPGLLRPSPFAPAWARAPTRP